MVQQRRILGGPVIAADLGRDGDILSTVLSDGDGPMNKKNLADLVIRQSEFKGEIGVARADITPPPNIYARSWGSAKHDAAEGIHRPLVTTCLFLRGGDPQLELYLLCFDLGWWYDNAHELEIRERILKESGIRDDQLVTHMGHTHSGPASNLQNVGRQ